MTPMFSKGVTVTGGFQGPSFLGYPGPPAVSELGSV